MFLSFSTSSLLSWARSRSQLRFVGSNILWQWQSTRAAQHFVVAGVKFMLISIMSNMLYFLYPVDERERGYIMPEIDNV